MMYELKDDKIIKNGHTMFLSDVVYDLNRKEQLETERTASLHKGMELREIIDKFITDYNCEHSSENWIFFGGSSMTILIKKISEFYAKNGTKELLEDFHTWVNKNYGRNDSKDKPYSKWLSSMLGGEEIKYTTDEVICEYIRYKIKTV